MIRVVHKPNIEIRAIQYNRNNIGQIIQNYFEYYGIENVTINTKTFDLSAPFHPNPKMGKEQWTVFPLEHWLIIEHGRRYILSPSSFRNQFDKYVDPDADKPVPEGYKRVDMSMDLLS